MFLNPDKQPFDGDETIIVVQPCDVMKELVMPTLKIFALAPFPLSDSPRCNLHISWEVVGVKKKRSILERLAAWVHQMINHTDRAEINRTEWRCGSPYGGLFESPGVSLPDAYHLCFNPSRLFFSLSFLFPSSLSLGASAA